MSSTSRDATAGGDDGRSDRISKRYNFYLFPIDIHHLGLDPTGLLSTVCTSHDFACTPIRDLAIPAQTHMCIPPNGDTASGSAAASRKKYRTLQGRRRFGPRPSASAIATSVRLCALYHTDRRSIACLAACSGSSRTLVHPRRRDPRAGHTRCSVEREHALAHLGAHLGAPTSRYTLDRRCAALKACVRAQSSRV